MKPVVQEERTGCGIASVAVLAGVTYKEAQRIANRLGIVAEDQRLWSDTRYVRKLLRHYGLKAASRQAPFVSWKRLPDVALLAIKWRRESVRPVWHWVVFARDPKGAAVLDSKCGLRKNLRTDFGRMNPKWFLAVRPPAA